MAGLIGGKISRDCRYLANLQSNHNSNLYSDIIIKRQVNPIIAKAFKATLRGAGLAWWAWDWKISIIY